MANKNYNPVRVKDPMSDNYVVLLHPNQGFDLYLTSAFVTPNLTIRSGFLRLNEKQVCGSDTIFRFAQEFDLTDWTKASKTYLGEVEITSESLSRIIKLKLMLSSDSEVIAVINPENDEIRLELDQQLEVVLFDKALSPSDIWEYQFIPSPNSGIGYEAIDQQIISSFNTSLKDEKIARRC